MGVNPEESSAPELTKKQELNNHKVLMRKWIRQAKVHVVHKLDREIKKLRERKGDEKTKEKCHRKADRLCKEVLAIKDLEIDDVAIKALLNDRPLNEVLTDTGATPGERACSRLIHHGAVQSEVEKYRRGNPHWKLQIPVLLERSKQKEKLADKKRQEKLKRKQRHQNKPENATTLKPSEEKGVVDNQSSAESSEEAIDEIADDKSPAESSEEAPGETVDDQSPAGTSEEEPRQTADDQSSAETLEEEPRQTADDQSSAESSEEAPDEPVSIPNKKQPTPSSLKLTEVKRKQPAVAKQPFKKPVLLAKTPESSKSVFQPLEIDKIEGTIKVQFIKDWSDFEKSITPSSASTVAETSEDNVDLTAGPEKKKPRSSFFLGGEDEPEPETPVIVEPRRLVPKISRNSKPGPVRPWRMNLDSVDTEPVPVTQRSKQSNTSRYFDKPSARSFTDSNRKTEPSFISPKLAATPAEEKLHPSWAAKKRQSIATAFQGKKIKFDD